MIPCYDNYFWLPRIPRICDLPPTIYYLLETIVNKGNENKVQIKNLASEGRSEIFDFDYPLSDKITKEEFEVMILNHFLMRRIGFETLTSFKIQLDVKLNEIMPLYNKMFDIIYSNLSLGNVTTKSGTDNRTMQSNTELNSNTNTVTKHSELPQNEIEAIEDSSYMTDYTSSNNNSGSTGSNNTNDNNIYNEETINSNNLENLIKIKNEMQNVYTLIFKDLECLFYELV